MDHRDNDSDEIAGLALAQALAAKLSVSVQGLGLGGNNLVDDESEERTCPKICTFATPEKSSVDATNSDEVIMEVHFDSVVVSQKETPAVGVSEDIAETKEDENNSEERLNATFTIDSSSPKGVGSFMLEGGESSLEEFHEASSDSFTEYQLKGGILEDNNDNVGPRFSASLTAVNEVVTVGKDLPSKENIQEQEVAAAGDCVPTPTPGSNEEAILEAKKSWSNHEMEGAKGNDQPDANLNTGNEDQDRKEEVVFMINLEESISNSSKESIGSLLKGGISSHDDIGEHVHVPESFHFPSLETVRSQEGESSLLHEIAQSLTTVVLDKDLGEKSHEENKDEESVDNEDDGSGTESVQSEESEAQSEESVKNAAHSTESEEDAPQPGESQEKVVAESVEVESRENSAAASASVENHEIAAAQSVESQENAAESAESEENTVPLLGETDKDDTQSVESKDSTATTESSNDQSGERMLIENTNPNPDLPKSRFTVEPVVEKDMIKVDNAEVVATASLDSTPSTKSASKEEIILEFCIDSGNANEKEDVKPCSSSQVQFEDRRESKEEVVFMISLGECSSTSSSQVTKDSVGSLPPIAGSNRDDDGGSASSLETVGSKNESSLIPERVESLTKVVVEKDQAENAQPKKTKTESNDDQIGGAVGGEIPHASNNPEVRVEEVKEKEVEVASVAVGDDADAQTAGSGKEAIIEVKESQSESRLVNGDATANEQSDPNLNIQQVKEAEIVPNLNIQDAKEDKVVLVASVGASASASATSASSSQMSKESARSLLKGGDSSRDEIDEDAPESYHYPSRETVESESDCPWLPERVESLTKVILEKEKRDEAKAKAVAAAASPTTKSSGDALKSTGSAGKMVTIERKSSRAASSNRRDARDDEKIECNCAKMCVLM